MLPKKHFASLAVLVLLSLGQSESHGQADPRRNADINPQQKQLLDRAKQLNAMAMKLLRAGKFAEAEVQARKALAMREQVLGPDHLEVSHLLNNLAAILIRLGRFADAEPLLTRSLKIRESQPNPNTNDILNALNDLAYLYQNTERFREVEPLFLRQLQILKKTAGPDSARVGLVLNNLAGLYMDTGRYAEAEANFTQALRIQEAVLGKDHLGVATVLNNLGLLYHRLARYSPAEAMLLRSLKIREAKIGSDHPDVGKSLNNLALVYVGMGRYKEAEPILLRAIKIVEAGPKQDLQELATRQNNLAALYDRLGRREEAEKLFVQSLEMAEKQFGPENMTVALRLNNLAVFYHDSGRFKDAARLYQRALDIYENKLGPNHIHLATPLANLSGLHVRLNDFAKAKELLERSVKIKEAVLGLDHPDVAAGLGGLAVIARLEGRFDDAAVLLERRLKIGIAKQGPRHGDVASTLGSLAVVKQGQGKTSEAIKLIEQCMEIQQNALEQILAISSEKDMFASLETVAGWLSSLTSMALDGNQDGVASALTWTLRRKGIVFDTLLRFRQAQSLLDPKDPLAPKVVRFRQLSQLLADAPLNPPKHLSAAEFAQQKALWKKEAGELEAELNRALAQKYPDQMASAGIDAQSVHKKLSEGSALVEFVTFGPRNFKATKRREEWLPGHYYAFVLVAGQDQPRLVDLGPAKAIYQAVAAVRTQIDKGQRLDADAEEEGEMTYRMEAKALYQLVFAKLRPLLGKSRLIYLATDGELNRIAFEALVDDQNKYLIENYRFAYQSCGRDLLRIRSAISGAGTVVFAGPDYDMSVAQRQQKVKGVQIAALGKETPGEDAVRNLRGDRWKALKGAAAEASDVREALAKSGFAPIQVFAGADALEENFKAIKSPRLLHVATHGFFLPDKAKKSADQEEPAEGLSFGAARGKYLLQQTDNPLLRSGLVLAGANTVGEGQTAQGIDDGWLTAAEIAMMDLRGTELVVLSACETGLGSVKTGEGVFGLRRAFMYAGARTLVTSLFSVPDAQTRDLMKNFYRQIQMGQSKVDALRNAQLALIQQRRQANGAAHPFFWASFVLVGDPE